METKHTPGPWQVIKGAYNSIRISDNPNDKRLAGIAQITEWAKPEVREANAHLIAAAPDLYRGLALLLPTCKAWLEDAKKADPHGWQSLDNDIAVAVAAIRKAKGE